MKKFAIIVTLLNVLLFAASVYIRNTNDKSLEEPQYKYLSYTIGLDDFSLADTTAFFDSLYYERDRCFSSNTLDMNLNCEIQVRLYMDSLAMEENNALHGFPSYWTEYVDYLNEFYSITMNYNEQLLEGEPWNSCSVKHDLIELIKWHTEQLRKDNECMFIIHCRTRKEVFITKTSFLIIN